VVAKAAHLARARQNEALALRLLDDWGSDPTAATWAVTVAYYAAVHYVEAFLYSVSPDLHSLNHTDREWLLRDHHVNFPVDAWNAYDQLKSWSKHARYGMRTFDPVFVRDTVIGGFLKRVAAAVPT
jgi:hypothetical protein